MSRTFILILVIIFQLSPNGTFAQRFLVSNEAQNILYAGVQNPLAIVVDGVGCNGLVIKTNNGIIEQNSASNTSCKYVIIPEKAGVANVFIHRKKGKQLKKVGEMAFRVKPLPPPEPAIGMLDKTSYSKQQLIAMGAVRAVLTGEFGCGDVTVKQFKATIVRNNRIIGIVDNLEARYVPELLQYLNELELNDQLLISDVLVTYPNKETIVLPKNLRYTIVESDVDE